MISLDHEIVRDHEARSVDWGLVTETQLRYDCFLGNITFVAAGIDLSADWGWIPILDFAIAMNIVAADLAEREGSVFDFIDSSLTIEFLPHDESVSIQGEHFSGVATAGITEFQKAASAMLSRVRSEIESAHPELLRNRGYLIVVGER